MARRKVDVEGALPPSTTTTTTRRMTRSQSHAPGAIPLAEKLTTPKRRAKKSGAATTTTTTSSGSGRKKSSTVATKKKTKTRKDTDDKGVKISPPQDSGFSFGDNGTQTTDTEVTEATEVTETDQTDQTDVDRTDTEVELTDVERSSVQQEEEVEEVDAPGVAAGDEGALAVIEEEREVEEVTETSVTKEAAGDGGGYLFKTLSTRFNIFQRQDSSKPNKGQKSGGIAVETTIAAETTIAKQITQPDINVRENGSAIQPSRRNKPKSALFEDDLDIEPVQANKLISDNYGNTRPTTTPKTRKQAAPTSSVLGKHSVDESEPSAARSAKRMKVQRPATPKSAVSMPYLDPNIRSLAFSFGADELSRIHMSKPQWRLRSGSPESKSNKENSNPDDDGAKRALVNKTGGENGNGSVHMNGAAGQTPARRRSSASESAKNFSLKQIEGASKSFPSMDEQQSATPTSASRGWGFRSLWGSVSRMLPGAQTEPRLPANRQDFGGMSADAGPASPTPFRANAQQSTNGNLLSSSSSSQTPQRALKASRSTVNGKVRTPGNSRPRERNADKRFAQHKAAWQIKEDNRRQKNAAKARRIQEAEEREQKRKTQIKIHVDELPEIPTHRPGESGAYGLLDEYFTYGSDSDSDVIEVADGQVAAADDKRNNEDDGEGDGDLLAEPDKPAKRAKTVSGKDGDEIPRFAPLPDYVGDPFASPAALNSETHRARPYTGKLFADEKDATTYKGGNVFGQSELFKGGPGSSEHDRSPGKRDRPGKGTKTVGFATGENDGRAGKTGKSSGVFRVPDDSDSDGDGDDESPQKSSSAKPSSLKMTSPSKGKSMLSQGSVGFGMRMAAGAQPNIFELGKKVASQPSAQKDENSRRGVAGNAAAAANDNGSVDVDENGEPNSDAENEPPLEPFTQAPPPRPSPAHATLPSASSTSTTSATSTSTNVNANATANASVNADGPSSDALARARSQAEKYKPKQPSGLRASSRLSSSTTLSDASADAALGADGFGEGEGVVLADVQSGSEAAAAAGVDLLGQGVDMPTAKSPHYTFPTAVPLDCGATTTTTTLTSALLRQQGVVDEADFDKKATEAFEARLLEYLEQV